ncbi:hypothetical protein WA026_020013 [Henosepilachna vigintioctopunctata]|uniref:Uncharacterized protein n=1 Tax=Henosepilachna vigintioctopunctata TaxID=420089 RepID=A0AAW1UVB9_9CUCU
MSPQLRHKSFHEKKGKTSSTKVGYIITNVLTSLTETLVSDAGIGDHKYILVTYVRDYVSEQKTSTCRSYRALSKENIEHLCLLLTEVDFSIIYHCPDINCSFSHFFDILTSSIEISCPLKYSGTPSKSNRNWITSEIIKASEDMKKLHWLSRNLQSEEAYNIYRSTKKIQSTSQIKKNVVSQNLSHIEYAEN